MKLAQGLECFPPDFFGKPFSHLDRMLDLVVPFDPPGETAEFRLDAREWISNAIARYEKGEESTPSEQDDAEHRRTQCLAIKARTQFLAGDYAEAGEIAAGVPGEEMRELRAWAHIMAGNGLCEQAEKTGPGPEADRFLAEAIEQYQAALAIKPDDHETFFNWGLALSEQAERKEGAEAQGLYRSAEEKLLRAEALAPGYAAYDLACVTARQDREDGVHTWLLKAREARYLAESRPYRPG